ncbi:MAG: hypothetical protein GXY53_01585 [Desulfobulbus sp.]|nr:hypothetical protein [Desulfobulbus sp.]
MLLTSVSPTGRFLIGCHRPSYNVTNLRERIYISDLGVDPDGSPVPNTVNFPEGDVTVTEARAIYEVRNALPFRGCSYIDSGWADARRADPGMIRIHRPVVSSLKTLLGKHCSPAAAAAILQDLPQPLRYTLAQTSTDPEELMRLAESCCRLQFNRSGDPVGLHYVNRNGRLRADIDDFELFETIANNPHLPDAYKTVMVLRPGVQGESEIVGDFQQDATEVFEYLRSNSYIPWGHYAANFAHTAIRYRITDLSPTDMQGVRHLYYQRIYTVVAESLGIGHAVRQRALTVEELEELRLKIGDVLEKKGAASRHLATLWGWNFGYDFSGSGYRLHASHQMIHQQYAVVPETVIGAEGEPLASFSCGDMVADVISQYRNSYQSDFFADYIRCLAENTRTDGQPGERSLIVWQDENVLLFVPKAQVSQWELQLMVVADSAAGPVGNVIEADSSVRHSIDKAILIAQQVLAELGVTMVSSIEYSKRIGLRNGQRLLYAFLPKLPWSMGAFSEAQGRFILGHYPEDFALACRRQSGAVEKSQDDAKKD